MAFIANFSDNFESLISCMLQKTRSFEIRNQRLLLTTTAQQTRENTNRFSCTINSLYNSLKFDTAKLNLRALFVFITVAVTFPNYFLHARRRKATHSGDSKSNQHASAVCFCQARKVEVWFVCVIVNTSRLDSVRIFFVTMRRNVKLLLLFSMAWMFVIVYYLQISREGKVQFDVYNIFNVLPVCTFVYYERRC